MFRSAMQAGCWRPFRASLRHGRITADRVYSTWGLLRDPTFVAVRQRAMTMSESRERATARPWQSSAMDTLDPATLDPAACYRALATRDARFDGRIFVGVASTGTYCRPICPARTAKFENCRFFPSAAAAQSAGFRPCLRCRPETAPDLASWRGTANTVSRALALIAEGGIGEGGVEELAERLGMGGRQLRRLFRQHLGATPIEVAQTRRVLLAKQLIHETGLPMAEVALAAGFGSIRRFNETFQALFGRPPSGLRRQGRSGGEIGTTLTVRYRPPYDWSEIIAHLSARAIAGVETIAENVYRRTVQH